MSVFEIDPGRSGLWDDQSESLRQRRDPVQTRRSILDAATEEFAAHGLEGGRTDRIASSADVNKRMIFHYFGSKEGLFQAVLEENYARIRSAEAKLELAGRDPIEAMAELVEFSFDWFVEHPEFVPLLNEANLHGGRHVKSSKQARDLTMPLVRQIENVLNRGVAQGQMRAGVDPIELYITIAGISYLYFSNRHTLSGIFGRDLMAKGSLASRRSHIVDVVLGYLRPDDGPEAAASHHED